MLCVSYWFFKVRFPEILVSLWLAIYSGNFPSNLYFLFICQSIQRRNHLVVLKAVPFKHTLIHTLSMIGKVNIYCGEEMLHLAQNIILQLIFNKNAIFDVTHLPETSNSSVVPEKFHRHKPERASKLFTSWFVFTWSSECFFKRIQFYNDNFEHFWQCIFQNMSHICVRCIDT